MINTWMVVVLLYSSLVNGVPSPVKQAAIPEDARVFFQGSEYNVPHSRQRRVGIQPPADEGSKDDLTATNIQATIITLSSTTTESSEAEDMLETSVHPKDDEDITTVKIIDKSVLTVTTESAKKIIANENKTDTSRNNSLASTTEMSTSTHVTTMTTTVAPTLEKDTIIPLNKEKMNVTDMPPFIFPENVSLSIAEAAPDIQNKLKYTTGFSNASVTPTTEIEFQTISSETTTSTLEPPTVTLQSREEQVEEKSNFKLLAKTEKAGLSAGIVALIIAIAFAIIAVLSYVGLIVHRRYLEYRHGNRELLVNDFDANDINNFEL